LEPTEDFLNIAHFCLFEGRPLKFCVRLSAFLVLFDDGAFSFYSMSLKTGLTLIRTSQFELPAQLDERRIFVLPARDTVIISAPWSPIFSISSPSRRKSELSAVHSSAITAIAADGDYCVSGAGDSSIVVWDLASETVLTHVVAHTSGIAAVAVSSLAEMLVSCDTSGLLVFSALRTGTFLQQMKLEKLPKEILLSYLGFCVLIFEEELETGILTETVLTDFSGRVLAKREYEGRCTAARIIHNRDASGFLVIAQETNIIYVMSIWDLKQVCIGPIIAHVVDISYYDDEVKLFFILDNGEVHTSSFAVAQRSGKSSG
jgi:hypothetical protein